MLVDGTITSCWSYVEHPELWSRKKGTTHDAAAFTETPVAEIVQNSGDAIADKGYQGHIEATPRKTPQGGELSKRDKESNAEISALPSKRMVAHFKNWKMLHTDYRRPCLTYRDAYDAAHGLFFFSITWGFE